MQRGEIKPLSKESYYHLVILKSHLGPRYAVGPNGNICAKLPSDAVPTVLNYRGKSWDMIYNGQNKGKKFDPVGWSNFVKDNNLKLGDACVFELMQSSKEKIVFEVQILRGDFPCEFPRIDESEEEPFDLSECSGTGENETPYVID